MATQEWFRTALAVARDRVQKLKAAGKSADEIAASKPFCADDLFGTLIRTQRVLYITALELVFYAVLWPQW